MSDLLSQALLAVTLLREKKQTLATAESLTGGLLGATVVSVPGASEIYKGGVISYTDEIKHKLLSVSNETLRTFTAVSEETASEMAKGASDVLSTDYALSTTGYAGPGGGTEKEPVGSVYVGFFHRGETKVFRLSLSGTREEIREKTVMFALQTLTEFVLKNDK